MNRSNLSYQMPFSNVAHLPLQQKLEATQVAGFQELSLMPVEVEKLLTEGLTFGAIKSMADDAGVRITRLDPLNTWPRIWRPDNMNEAYIESVATTPDRFFELAEGLGCTHASLNATFPLNSMTTGEITEHYGSICQRAEEHGLHCDLESIPLWGVPTLSMAWDIVRSAGMRNGGLVFDVWHFVRSKSSLELLQQIPGSMIKCVQLNDGPLELPSGVSLKDDCYNRFFPGEGEFPNVEVVRILSESGGLNQVGPEVFSPTLERMTADEVGLKSAESTRRVLTRAGVVSRSA